jgi:hypothetical protein
MGETDNDIDRCASIACAVVGYGDLAEAVADLHRLPAGLAARGPLAAGLIEVLLNTDDPSADPAKLRSLGGLLEIAESAPPAGARWRSTRACARVVELMRAVAEGELRDPAVALNEVDELAAEVGDDPARRVLFDSARLGLTYARAVYDGDAGALDRMPDQVRHVFGTGSAPLSGDALTMRDLMTGMADLMAAQQRDEDVSGSLDRLLELAGKLPPGHHLRAAVEEAGETVATLRRAVQEDGAPVTDEELERLVEMTRRPGLSVADRTLAHAQVGMAALGLGTETRPDRVDLGVRYLRQAVEFGGAGDAHRVFHLAGLGLGLYRRGELTNVRKDLLEARSVLMRARDLAGGPAHGHWSVVNSMLADVNQLLGDSPGFHHDALAGLQSYVWQVLVQPDLASASVSVLSAARDAATIARQCLTAGDLAGAVGALDAGRGLALFAATELRTIAERLTEVGETELAGRWRAALSAGEPSGPPGDLRREVLAMLSTHGSAADLLQTPGLDEIRDALSAVDADALVYIMPGEESSSGYALAVPAGGEPALLPLPGLVAGVDAEVKHYLSTLTGDAAELGDSLESLCGWAWRAVIGPLLETYVPRLPAPTDRRPPRLVLVPMGDFALIPWQAARHPDGTHAVERVALSQAVSARMLCLAAGLWPVPPSANGLVVGDPDTGDPKLDLRSARLEAYGIRQSFYPGARYVGRRPDTSESPSGPGTADQVRDWLTSDDPSAGGTLHLACHGFVRAGAREASAYLVLARGEILTAAELSLLMARNPERAIELVVLAACRTGEAFNGHDEAYSLGTGFLAGGVRSVLCTLWNIPDGLTSVMMYAFHHYLRVESMPVWAALREAQLWMLDPRRQELDGMPAQLARRCRSPLLADLRAWAAFVHWGR